MGFVDHELKCVECGAVFLFSAGEQAFFHLKAFQHLPKRCKQCRARKAGKKRITKETQIACAECGITTIVPFTPTRNEPVYCCSCYLLRRKLSEEKPRRT
jgi:CxxC-x17-CxxC domain-containing protein